MQDFKKLIALIQNAVDKFDDKVPAIQQKMLDSIRIELKALDLNTQGNIIISAKNIRKIAEIKSKLQAIVLSPEYLSSVKEFVLQFNEVTALQNEYFNTVLDNYSVPEVVAELKNQAIVSAVERLTEAGIKANVIQGVEDLLRQGITTGGSYLDLLKTLEDNVIDNEVGDGKLHRYLKQTTVDSINQFSAEYTTLVAADLGFEWFRFSGSLIVTSRPWCLACTDKRWIHISEFPALISGDFEEFNKYDGKIYKGLPAGMYPDTNVSNLQVKRGGYNCGHQLRPVSENLVPLAARRKVYATTAYQQWVIANGKDPKGNTPADKMRKQKKDLQETVMKQLRGTSIDVDGIGQVKFNRSGIEHAFGNSKSKDYTVKLAAINKIVDIIGRGKFDRFEADRKSRSAVSGVHILKSTFEGKGVEVIFRETNHGGIAFYDLRII